MNYTFQQQEGIGAKPSKFRDKRLSNQNSIAKELSIQNEGKITRVRCRKYGQLFLPCTLSKEAIRGCVPPELGEQARGENDEGTR